MLTKRVKMQLAALIAVALVAGGVMVFGYINVPALLNVGRYTVTVQLPRAAGLYASGNVTYRGTEVGRVTKVLLTKEGVDAVLSLRSNFRIPADLDAEVHSVSAIGEQFVSLTPRSSDGPALRNGDVIPMSRTAVPPDINALLGAANNGLKAIPHDSVKTLVDESYLAVGGLGSELSRIVRGSTTLAIDAGKNIDAITTLIDQSGPLTESQAKTAGAIQAWAGHVADLTRQFKTQDAALAGILQHGGEGAEEARKLVDQLQPTLPVLMANLTSVGQVAVAYHPAIEQLLVIFPQLVAITQGSLVMNRDSKRPYPGLAVNFNLNLNYPPPCTTGFLPVQQLHAPAVTETPDLPPGALYCRIPKDSYNVVRGARNYPCLTRPGKRAPTAAMCESDEEYVPLNDGNNWKGDQNATLSGQDIPQLSPGQQQPQSQGQLPVVGSNDPLINNNPEGQTWQSMLIPPN